MWRRDVSRVSAAALAQALRSKACSGNDLAAKNSPGPWRRAPPVGIGAKERPGDESACARLCVSASRVVNDRAAITSVLSLPARFSREEASPPVRAGSASPRARSGHPSSCLGVW